MKIYIRKEVCTRERAINRDNFLPKRFIHMPGQPLFIKYFLFIFLGDKEAGKKKEKVGRKEGEDEERHTGHIFI